MNMFLILSATMCVAMASSPTYHHPSPNSYHQPEYHQPSPYAFGYTIDDGYGNKNYRNEQSDSYGNKKGAYGYTDAYGVYRWVEYTADHNGFRANIKTNEPGTKNENPADVYITALEPPAHTNPGSPPSYSHPSPAYSPPAEYSPSYPTEHSSYEQPEHSSYPAPTPSYHHPSPAPYHHPKPAYSTARVTSYDHREQAKGHSYPSPSPYSHPKQPSYPVHHPSPAPYSHPSPPAYHHAPAAYPSPAPYQPAHPMPMPSYQPVHQITSAEMYEPQSEEMYEPQSASYEQETAPTQPRYHSAAASAAHPARKYVAAAVRAAKSNPAYGKSQYYGDMKASATKLVPAVKYAK